MLTNVASVLGGCLGYILGVFLFSTLGEAIIEFYHAEEQFLITQQWFAQYGIWVVVIAGFTPLPYKLFTISAGLLGMALLPFVGHRLSVVGTFFSRGGTYLLGRRNP
ncbi:MAG: hypothetical protein CM1200mP41_30260 [Gammaproteobacteria bacterium]|nr:MAG: hypothetical protein CM1200mP41_30260 [Gammaproteobacteria bacterium]